MALWGLEKACDRVDKKSLWKVLQMFVVGGKLPNSTRMFSF